MRGFFLSKIFFKDESPNRLLQQLENNPEFVSELNKFKEIARQQNQQLKGTKGINPKQIQRVQSQLSKFTEDLFDKGEKDKAKFEEKAYVNFDNKYGNFNFHYLGLIEDNIIMLEAMEEDTDVRMQILASTHNADLKEVKDYIAENHENLFYDVSMDALNNVKIHQTLGSYNNFDGVDIYRGESKDGQLLLLGMAKRSDGRGSYLTILSGSKDEIYRNEGKYESYFETFKARDYESTSLESENKN